MAVSKERRELLLRKIIKANLPPEPTCGPNDTISFLVSLTAAWPGPITGEQKSGLEALCRQLAVTRKVLQSYDVEWKRATDSHPLGAQQWTILILELLAEYEDGEGAGQQIHAWYGVKTPERCIYRHRHRRLAGRCALSRGARVLGVRAFM